SRGPHPTSPDIAIARSRHPHDLAVCRFHEKLTPQRFTLPGGSVMAILERGTHIAGHIIVRLIGAGRIADVYEAVAPEGAHRAVKLHREAAPLAARSQRSVGQEADAIARLDHVNVVGFYDTGIDEGRGWISLEL